CASSSRRRSTNSSIRRSACGESASGSSGIGMAAPSIHANDVPSTSRCCERAVLQSPHMIPRRADVVVCGAGIAGIAAAYHLAVRRGLTDVVIVDERPPLSLTSDKSTECYRNWWPGPGDEMVALMNRSIDLLEELARESGNDFRMNRRGYLFATADPALVPGCRARAREGAGLGSGPARVHDHAGSDYRPASADGFDGEPIGSDVITDRSLIRRHFGWLADDTAALLHARRCGWFSGQQL